MNSASIDDQQLQRLFDGDLPPEDAAAVRHALEHDAELQARYRRLERLQVLLAQTTQQAAEQVDFEAMYRQIQQQVQQEQVATQAPRHAAARPTDTASEPAWIARVRDWFTASAWMPAAGTVAVAAAVLLMFYSQRENAGPGGLPAPAVDREATGAQAPGAHARRSARRHSEVVAVDFGSGTGTVFEVDLSDGVSAPVVWINDG